MDGVHLPYLPTTLWLLSAALAFLVVLVVFAYHLYWRRRETALLKDVDSAAELAAKNQILEAEMEARRQWMEMTRAIELKGSLGISLIVSYCFL